jgi:hypothetical protein
VTDASKPSPGRAFAVGDRVRVRRGVTDPDFPDLPIGGWAGTVVEVQTQESPPTCLVRWGRATLDAVHPVFRKRSERDGFDIGEMWLGHDDLEPDDGAGVGIEQPSALVTKPLSADDQDDRVRAVLGLTSDDSIPLVDEQTLRAFHEHLSAKLTFPIRASLEPEGGPARPITILGLAEPDDDLGADDGVGLICRGTVAGRAVEVPLAECVPEPRSPYRQHLADYAYWFWNCG